MWTKKKIQLYTIILTFTFLTIIFCILVLLKNNNFEEEYSFDLSLPSKNFYEDNYGCSLEKILSYRNFTTYKLSNEPAKDKLMFKEIQMQIKKTVALRNPKKGIHVKLDAKTKYESVIRILEICETEKAPVYILKDYDIWIFAGINEDLKKDCPPKFKTNY